MRGMAATYVLVFGGFLGGLAIGVFVLDYHPAYLGWLFGGGAGLSVGAFIANARLLVYEGGDHGLCWTRKERVNADLLAFLKS